VWRHTAVEVFPGFVYRSSTKGLKAVMPLMMTVFSSGMVRSKRCHPRTRRINHPKAFVDQVRLNHDMVRYRQPIGYEHRVGIDFARGVRRLQLEPSRPGNIVISHEVFATYG
jgi:hypothetical protein